MTIEEVLKEYEKCCSNTAYNHIDYQECFDAAVQEIRKIVEDAWDEGYSYGRSDEAS